MPGKEEKRSTREILMRPLDQTTELEIIKRVVGSSVRIKKMSVKTLRSQPLPKRKKRLLAA
jgi:hypothetical protein